MPYSQFIMLVDVRQIIRLLFIVVLSASCSKLDVYLAKNFFTFSPMLVVIFICISVALIGALSGRSFFSGRYFLAVSCFFLLVGLVEVVQAFDVGGNGAIFIDYLLILSYLLFFFTTGILIRWGVISVLPIIYISFFLVVGSVIFEGFNPGVFSKTFYRAAGFPENSNSSALIICVSIVFVLNYTKLLFKDSFILGLAFVALLLCASRAGILVYIFIVLAWFLSIYLRLPLAARFNFFIRIGVGVWVAVVAFSIIVDRSEIFQSEATRNRVVLPGQMYVENMDKTRVNVLAAYLSEIDKCFPFPCGVDRYYASEKHSHNTSVNYAYKYGLIFILFALLPLFVLFVYSRMFRSNLGADDAVRIVIFVLSLVLFSFVNNDIYSNKIVLLVMAYFFCNPKTSRRIE